MSELALKLIRECKETRATSLDLGNCGLTELPDELFELVWLEELYLSPTIKQLDSEQREGNNYIREIPIKLKKLYKLKKIFANGLGIEKIDGFAFLNQLLILEISGNFIQNLGPIRGLKSLTEFYVSNKEIKSLDALVSLYNLRVLSIRNTNVKDMNPLNLLKNLKILNISQTKISDITVLKNFNHLTEFEAYGTDIINIEPLRSCQNLEKVSLRSTKITSVESLEGCSNIFFLDISKTEIKDFYPLRKIILKGIDLIANNYVDKRYEKGINVFGCPAIDELFRMNPYWTIKNINNYYRQRLKQGITVGINEAKLIVVGEGGVGKTTLFEKLKNSNYKIKDTQVTHSINIYEGLELPFKSVETNPIKRLFDKPKQNDDNKKTEKFRVNMWDFGGQEILYMTHQFFLSPNALYILLVDSRRESPNLAYWFKIISLLGTDGAFIKKKVKVLLVKNKKDKLSGSLPFQDVLKYYEEDLDVQYLEVDLSSNDSEWDFLKTKIEFELRDLSIMKDKLPKQWKNIRRALKEEFVGRNYISTAEFDNLCKKYSIDNEDDQWNLSSYLHQLGSLLHFQDEMGLRSLLIMSPQWVVDGVYSFLSNENIINNNGHFTEKEFMQLLVSQPYTRTDADVILQLMTKNNFDICYEATNGHYVAAQLLPDNAPLSIKWFPKEVLQFRYQYPIMPKGLMSRLIVRLSDYIERDKKSNEQIVWKKGVILHMKLNEGECRVRLLEDDAESKAGLRQILIDVMGGREARKYALRKVRDTVEDLHKKWFRSIKADEMVPCCCSECRISDTPQLYKLDNLLKLRSKGHTIPVRCFDSAEEVSTQELLEGVYDKNEIKEKDNETKYRD